MIDEKYICDGEEIDDIRYEEGTFISFRKNNDSFTLEGNVAGLKSFIKILNKLLRKYNYVLLRDGFISDYYIYNADYFFDCCSVDYSFLSLPFGYIVTWIFKYYTKFLENIQLLY